jgi:hypothetical protein
MSSPSNLFSVNGKTYNSLDEMPPEVRAQFETMQNMFADKNQNGMPDILEGVSGASAAVMQTAKIIYEGKMYDSVEQLPPDARAKYDAAMSKLADENKNGMPDVMEDALKTAPTVVTTQFSRATLNANTNSASSNLGPMIVLGIVSVGLAVIILILLLLLVYK